MRLSEQQRKAVSSQADICIYGGGNGGGKTQALIWIPLLPDYLARPGCTTVIFAETVPKLKQPGGLVDKTQMGTVGGVLRGYAPLHPAGLEGYNRTDRRWTFPTLPGQDPSTITLSYVGEPGQWDGGEFALVLLDQAEQIEAEQFFSLVSRNRSTSGARCRLVATANPPDDGPAHWLTKLLTAGGYLDTEGFPRPEMDGRVRWLTRVGQEFIFGDTAVELLPHCEMDRDGKPIPPRSFAFVSALIDDHPDPAFREAYRQQLALLPEVERLRRLRGCWYATEDVGKYFRREFFSAISYAPTHEARLVRSWDNAWSASESADWTPGVLVALEPDGFWAALDLIRFRGTYRHVERAVKLIAELDGRRVLIRLPKDAGAAGGLQSELARWLGARGYEVQLTADRGDKLSRSKPYQACCERREVRLARSHTSREVAQLLTEPFVAHQSDGARIEVAGLDVSGVSTLHGWHESFVADHVRFGRATIHKRSVKKDVVDAMVGAYEVLTSTAGTDPADVDEETLRREVQRAQRELGVGSRGGLHGSGAPVSYRGARKSGWL